MLLWQLPLLLLFVLPLNPGHWPLIPIPTYLPLLPSRLRPLLATPLILLSILHLIPRLWPLLPLPILLLLLPHPLLP